MSDEKIKVFYIESTDPYSDVSVVDGSGFFDESQAVALETQEKKQFGDVYSYMIQELYVKFSHRNGEIDPPEIDGYYWKKMMGEPVPLFVMDEWRRGRWQHWDASKNITPLYGPIPTPEKI